MYSIDQAIRFQRLIPEVTLSRKTTGNLGFPPYNSCLFIILNSISWIISLWVTPFFFNMVFFTLTWTNNIYYKNWYFNIMFPGKDTLINKCDIRGCSLKILYITMFGWMQNCIMCPHTNWKVCEREWMTLESVLCMHCFCRLKYRCIHNCFALKVISLLTLF